MLKRSTKFLVANILLSVNFLAVVLLSILFSYILTTPEFYAEFEQLYDLGIPVSDLIDIINIMIGVFTLSIMITVVLSWLAYIKTNSTILLVNIVFQSILGVIILLVFQVSAIFIFMFYFVSLFIYYMLFLSRNKMNNLENEDNIDSEIIEID